MREIELVAMIVLLEKAALEGRKESVREKSRDFESSLSQTIKEVFGI